MMKACLMTGIALLATTGLACAQDVAAGEIQFKKCAPCHDVGEKAKNKVGPVLNGLDGRKSGTIPNFKYSEAMQKADKTWDAPTLDTYIANPRGEVPGSKMIFAGVKDAGDRANLIAYLQTLK